MTNYTNELNLRPSKMEMQMFPVNEMQIDRFWNLLIESNYNCVER